MEIKQPHVTLIQGTNAEIDIHIAFRFSRRHIIGKRAPRDAGANRSDSAILSEHIIGKSAMTQGREEPEKREGYFPFPFAHGYARCVYSSRAIISA